jgi:hypothetical protein
MVTGTNCRDFEGGCPVRCGLCSYVDEAEKSLLQRRDTIIAEHNGQTLPLHTGIEHPQDTRSQGSLGSLRVHFILDFDLCFT